MKEQICSCQAIWTFLFSFQRLPVGVIKLVHSLDSILGCPWFINLFVWSFICSLTIQKFLYLIILVFISLVTTDIEYQFVFIFHLPTFKMNCLFIAFAQFLTQLYIYFTFESSIYILSTKPTYVTCIYFLPVCSLSCLFI